MERTRSDAGLGGQFRAERSRHLLASPQIATESDRAGALFLARRSHDLFAGAVRALDFGFGISLLSAAAVPGDGAHAHPNGPSDPWKISHLGGARDGRHFHARAWIARVGTYIPVPLDCATPFALAILVGDVAGRDGDVRRDLFLGLRKADVSAAIRAACLDPRLRAFHPGISRRQSCLLVETPARDGGHD